MIVDITDTKLSIEDITIALQILTDIAKDCNSVSSFQHKIKILGVIFGDRNA